MFLTLISSVSCDISENAYPVFKGNWSVKSEYLFNNTKQENSYYIHCDQFRDNENYLTFSVKDINESTEVIDKFNIRFTSNGRFRFSVAEDNSQDYIKVDLFYNIRPHASATGVYNEDYIYNLDVITFKKIQLTVFNQRTGELYVWNLFKILEPQVNLFEKYRFFFYAGILFIITNLASQTAIKRYEKKMRAQQQARPKPKQNTPNNKDNKAKTPSKPKTE
ncbi:hypothetical protein TVAG_016250 [Trichomonas vaginalis G3]|uniref:Uncharacterized protein n=1 Tax=Trichomonas vaginalis (strain ATCC PRA-98 / G3) TaxID=412133 RepID=A2DP95_TRIV3|nr:hypothetical protein TVAGG3_0910370 [Trichomonas vaginalis G3]EAY17795.1 hypothetical protein TVAG_016250 [Trichomonas vaginalis G3]KAI5484382.1 hypothetical protein TVAGG3_0910370 [Trichomonas vaginalis G3]|eukprot:XP_001329930.1 hypothetical protein [Trichomonas vaginalis G3]